MRLRIVVAGNRTFDDQARADAELDAALAEIAAKGPIESVEFVSGGCRGADALGEAYARKRGWPITVMPAEWEKYGRAAGPIRNAEMLDYARAETPRLVAFWDGRSHGTRDVIARANEKGVPTKIVYL